ncbi:hypothetical protein EDD36DRAFT_161404 [Exophiala viscosa]|uniref:Uncharacterized protein n=1 Tax=Exophiala viscosa TaxID=2486360 RepID=A0AAN6E548_9EURO|nr:hypothetical protein EDD36DRAFT_161404 [Exophiala viscosa]
MNYSPEIRDYVNRSFEQARMAPTSTRAQMEEKLKEIIEDTTQSGLFHGIKWKELPLLLEMIQNGQTVHLLAPSSRSSSFAAGREVDTIKSAPEQEEYSQAQKRGQVARQPTNLVSKPDPSSTLSSTKQPQPTKNAAVLSEDEWHPSKLDPKRTSLRFTKGAQPFDIRDHHLDLVVAGGSGFCHKIEDFSYGDDSMGFGSYLSDAAVMRLAAACPNLRKVYLTPAVNLTDDALLAFLTHCPKIHTLSITGNDKGPKLRGWLS